MRGRGIAHLESLWAALAVLWLALVLDGSGNWFSGQRFAAVAPQVPQPFDLLLWHYTVGLEYELTRPSPRGLVVKLSGGLGATTLNTDGFGPTANPISGRLETDFNKTYVSTVGGLALSS